MIRIAMFACLLPVIFFSGAAYAQQLTPLKPATSESDSKTEPQVDALDRLTEAARKLQSNQTFDLRYQFQEGETILWETEHIFTTDVRKGPEQSHTTGRALCVMQWQVTDVDSLEQATVVLTLKSAKMWQQDGQETPVEYDSNVNNGEVPPQYKAFDEWIGIPIATYTIDPYGRVRDRKETFRDIKFGMGHVTLPLPDRELRIGDRWHSNDSIQVTTREGTVKRIKTRLEYRFQEVKDGIALISVDTQVLTPVNDERIQSQLLQQLSRGIISFDMNEGKMLEKRLDWDQKSIGYAGPESALEYLAKYHTRRLSVSDNDQAQDEVLNLKRQLQARIRLADEGPVLRW